MKKMVLLFVLTVGRMALGDETNATALRPISGAWHLDAARSQDLREKMRAQMERDRGAGEGRSRPGGPGMGSPGGGMEPGGGPRGGMGGPRGPRRGPPSRDALDPRAMREALDDILSAPEKLAITARTSDVEMFEGDGDMHRMRPDGRKLKHEDNAVTETSAKWEGDSLVHEVWLGPMMHVTERYTADATTRELTVEVTVKGPRGDPVTARWVYVRDGAAGAEELAP